MMDTGLKPDTQLHIHNPVNRVQAVLPSSVEVIGFSTSSERSVMNLAIALARIEITSSLSVSLQTDFRVMEVSMSRFPYLSYFVYAKHISYLS